MAVYETPVEAFAHCSDALCDGYDQQPAAGIRTLVEETIGDRGGDGVFVSIVEKTTEYFRFADPEDIACPACGRDREISVQERPVYTRLIGPPDALLRARAAGIQGPGSPEGVNAASAAAASRQESPRELLDRRFVNGDIEQDEYFAKRGILEGSAS